jgi:Ca2+-dependent lipid-binding protein
MTVWVVGSVRSGRNLLAKDFEVYGASSDPYVVVWLGAPDLVNPPPDAQRSNVVFHSLNPDWNFHFELEVDEEMVPQTSLHVRVFDFDANKTHDYMGDMVMPLKENLEMQWIELKALAPYEDEEIKGELEIEFQISNEKKNNPLLQVINIV